MSHSPKAPEAGQRFNPYRLFCGIHIPNAVCRHRGLTSNAKLVYGRLAQFAGENGRCFPSIKKLAEELALSKRTIITAIQALEEEGFLEKQAAGPHERRKTNAYYFLWHEVFNDALRVEGEKVAPIPSGDPSPGVKKAHQGGEEIALKEIPEREPGKTTTTTSEESGGGCIELSEEQERFIDLKVRYMEATNQIRNSPGSLKAGLKRRARDGVLDLDELPYLEQWDKMRREAERNKRHEEAVKHAHEEGQRLQEELNRERVKREIKKSGKSPAELWATLEAERGKPEHWKRKVLGVCLPVARKHFKELYPDIGNAQEGQQDERQ